MRTISVKNTGAVLAVLGASFLFGSETDVKYEDLSLSVTATNTNYLGQDGVSIMFTLTSADAGEDLY